jgi:DnaJ-domain-containing protein 1
MIGWGPVVVVILAALAGYALVLAIREFVRGAGEALHQHAQRSSSQNRPESDRLHGAGERRDKRSADDDPVSRPNELGWHDVLEIKQSASIEEIKYAYRRMIALYHPDRVAGLGNEFKVLAERRAKEINAAYASARQLYSTSRERP